MNRYQSPYGVYPQQPYVSVQPPQWADPMKLEQKELRRVASRLSFAALAGLPLQYIFINVAAIILMLCGVNLLAPTGNTVGGLPATAYYLVASMMSYFSIVLPYALFLAVGRRRLRDTVLVEKTGALNGILLVLAGVFVCMVMTVLMIVVMMALLMVMVFMGMIVLQNHIKVSSLYPVFIGASHMQCIAVQMQAGKGCLQLLSVCA